MQLLEIELRMGGNDASGMATGSVIARIIEDGESEFREHSK